jgi:hypothetical protein
MSYTVTAMDDFADEMREAVAASNDFVRREVERSLAEGHSMHFLHEGRIVERTREDDFELVWVGGLMVRRRLEQSAEGRSSVSVRRVR